MTKNIKQIKDYNRRKIICAVHGTEDYEEALGIELNKAGYHKETFKNSTYSFGIFLDKLLTLDRVLLTLISVDYLEIKQTLDKNILSINGICWDLNKPTLEEQDYETKLVIYKLLGGK